MGEDGSAPLIKTSIDAFVMFFRDMLRWLKSSRFKLPIIEKDFSIGLDNGKHVETVVKLSLKKDTPRFV